MDEIVDGRAAPAQVAGLLVGLAMKGERPDEIVGFATAMRDRAVQVPVAPATTVDLCGTGGDGSGSFNISSAAAIVAAACGVTVAKHGNRSVSSRCGSADVFEALGVSLSAAPEVLAQCLARGGHRVPVRAVDAPRRCATSSRCAESWAFAPRSTCSARSPTRRGRPIRSSACRARS